MSTQQLDRAPNKPDRPNPPKPLPAKEIRRVTTAGRRTGRLLLVAAAVAAVLLTMLLFDQVAPFTGMLAFLAVAYGLFLGIYAVLCWLDGSGLAVRDRLASVVVHTLALVTLVALIFVVGYTFWRGRSALAHLNFFTQDLSSAGSLDPLTKGGVLHAAVGTLEQIGIALVVTVPAGLACAVFLNETRGRFTRFVRTVVEAMTALPSIVAGLFIYASLILGLGLQKSGLAAGCAISVMMLPIVIRAADVVIRLVPAGLREASLALGAGQWRTAWHVVLPTARSGLTTAVLLGTARGIGETSPVLITAGFTAYTNTDPAHGPQVSLPLETFQLVQYPEPTMVARGFGSASVLLGLVLVLFVLARLVGRTRTGGTR